jgi:hypothetical protein
LVTPEAPNTAKLCAEPSIDVAVVTVGDMTDKSGTTAKRDSIVRLAFDALIVAKKLHDSLEQVFIVFSLF